MGTRSPCSPRGGRALRPACASTACDVHRAAARYTFERSPPRVLPRASRRPSVRPRGRGAEQGAGLLTALGARRPWCSWCTTSSGPPPSARLRCRSRPLTWLLERPLPRVYRGRAAPGDLPEHGRRPRGPRPARARRYASSTRASISDFFPPAPRRRGRRADLPVPRPAEALQGGGPRSSARSRGCVEEGDRTSGSSSGGKGEQAERSGARQRRSASPDRVEFAGFVTEERKRELFRARLGERLRLAQGGVGDHEPGGRRMRHAPRSPATLPGCVSRCVDGVDRPARSARGRRRAGSARR